MKKRIGRFLIAALFALIFAISAFAATKITLTPKVMDAESAGTKDKVEAYVSNSAEKKVKYFKLDRKSIFYADFKRGAKDSYSFSVDWQPWEITEIGLIIGGKDALFLEYVDWKLESGSFVSYNHTYLHKWISRDSEEGNSSVYLFYGDLSREVTDNGNFGAVFGGREVFPTADTASGTKTFTWNCRSSDQYGTNVNPLTLPQPPAMSYTLAGLGKSGSAVCDASADAALRGAFTDVFSSDGDLIGFTVDKAALIARMKEKGLFKVTVKTTLAFPTVSTKKTAYRKMTANYEFVRSLFRLDTQNTAVTTVPYTAMRDNLFFNTSASDVTLRVPVVSDKTYLSHYDAAAIAASLNFSAARLYYGAGSGDFVPLKSKKVTGNAVDLTFDISSVVVNNVGNTGLTLRLDGVTAQYDGKAYVLEGANFSKLFPAYKLDRLAPTVTVTADDGADLSGVWRTALPMRASVNEEVYPVRTSSIADDQMPYHRGVFVMTLTGPGTNVTQKIPAVSNAAVSVACAAGIESDAFRLTFSGSDFAGNLFSQTFENVCLDRKAPSVVLGSTAESRAADGSKSVLYTFSIGELSGTGRLHYCFVPAGVAVPSVQNEQAVSGRIETLIGRWAFIDQHLAPDAVAVLKIAENETFDGKLVYYADDALGNVSERVEYPVYVSNTSASANVTVAPAAHPLMRYDVAFDAPDDVAVYYRWKSVGSRYTLYDPASGAVGDARQTDEKGRAVTLNGKQLLEYKAVHKISGNTEVYEGDKGLTLVFDNASSDIGVLWDTAVTSAPVRTVRVKAEDISAVTAASYRIVTEDGRSTSVGDTPLAVVGGVVSDSFSTEGLASGRYLPVVTVVDGNGNETVKEGAAFNVRPSAPAVSAAVNAPVKDGAYLLSSRAYTVTIDVHEPYLCAYLEKNKQAVKVRASGDGVNFSDWIEIGEPDASDDAFDAEGLAFSSPVVPVAGENRLYLQVMCVERAKNVSGVTGEDAFVATLAPLALYYDTEAPKYRAEYEEGERTNQPVEVRVTLSDNLTASPALSCTDPAVTVTKEAEAGVYTVLTAAADPVLFAADEAGNVTAVELRVPNLDAQPPIVEFDTPEPVAVGSRTDGSVTVRVRNADPVRTAFAVVPDGETFDGTAEDREIKNLAVLEQYEIEPDGTGDAYTKSMEYRLALKGLDGAYRVGVYAVDDLGNACAVVSDAALQLTDSAPAILSVNAPAKAVDNAFGTVNFNTPVYILPQSMMISSADVPADETRSADEINLDNAVLEAFRCGTDTSVRYAFPETADGNYRLFVADDVGRACILNCHIDTAFCEGIDVDVQLYQLESVSGTRTPVGPDDYTYIGFYRDITDPDGEYVDNEVAALITSVDTDAEVHFFPYFLNENGTMDDTFTDFSPACPFSPDNNQNMMYYAYDEYDPDKGFRSLALKTEGGYSWEAFEIKQSAVKYLQFGALIYEDGSEEPIIQNFTIPLEKIFTTYPTITYAVTPENEPAETVTVRVSAFDTTARMKRLIVMELAAEREEVWEEIEAHEADFLVDGVLDEEAYYEWQAEYFRQLELQCIAEAKVLDFDYDGEQTDDDITSDEAYTVTFTVDHNTMYLVSAVNEYGLESSDMIYIDNIHTDPLSEGHVTLSKYLYLDGDWQEDDGASYAAIVKTVLSPADEENRRRIYVKNNGGAAEALLTTDVPVFTYQLRDGYEYDLAMTVGFDRFDTTPPAVQTSLSTTEKTNAPISLSVNVSDEGSGVSAVSLMRGDEPVALAETAAGSFAAEIVASGVYTVRAVDRAGNAAVKNVTVSNIDTTAPTLRYTLDTTAYTRKGVTATLSFDKSGVTVVTVEPVTGGSLHADDLTVDLAAGKIRFSENGSAAVAFKDEYGNVGTGIVTVTNIYKEAPTLVAVPVLADDEMSVTVTFEKQTDENGFPLDRVRALEDFYVFYGGTVCRVVDENGVPASFILRRNGAYVFSVYDEAGAMQYINLSVTGIDREAPVVTQISWNYDYLKRAGDGFSLDSENGTHIPSAAEAGYVIANDLYARTNQPVEITVTTDKPTSLMGVPGDRTTTHSLTYSDNGLFIFNLQKANDLSVSYGVDVELIDKTAPVMTFASSGELLYLEGATPYRKADLLDVTATDTFAGVTTDLTEFITVDWGGFDPDDFSANVFDRRHPYTVTYTVADDAGNVTSLRRKITLLGMNDAAVTVNGRMPDASGDMTVEGDSVTLSLLNFSGVSFAKHAAGYYTFGQMKTTGSPLEANANGGYTVEGLPPGWHTFLVQTDLRDYFTIHVYVAE